MAEDPATDVWCCAPFTTMAGSLGPDPMEVFAPRRCHLRRPEPQIPTLYFVTTSNTDSCQRSQPEPHLSVLGLRQEGAFYQLISNFRNGSLMTALSSTDSVQRITSILASNVDELAQEVASAVRAEVDFYKTTRAVTDDALLASCTENLRFALESLEDGAHTVSGTPSLISPHRIAVSAGRR
jgi:hypothetical protein